MDIIESLTTAYRQLRELSQLFPGQAGAAARRDIAQDRAERDWRDHADHLQRRAEH